MTTRFLAGILTLLVGAIPAYPQGMQSPAEPESKDRAAVVEAGNEFALKLYTQASAGQGNVFFSPLSISSALTMAYAGAAGETAQEMATVLGIPADRQADASWVHGALGKLTEDLNNPPKDREKQPAFQLSVANRLWGQAGYVFLPEYLGLLQRSYGAGLETVDFKTATEASRIKINQWIEQQTRGKIKDLIPAGALDSDSRLVITNAVYFKSAWMSQFSQQATKDGEFRVSDQKTVSAKLMFNVGRFHYFEDEALQAVSMPYSANALSMVVLLPRDKAGIGKLEQSLTAARLQEIAGKLASERVELTFPRFRIEKQLDLVPMLKSMGMTLAMQPGKADFSGMTGNRDLNITAALHKAYVDVNEEGTEAAAATAIVIGRMSADVSEPKEFKADHPFVFLIRHNSSGAILFMGRVADPNG